ncbi:MULTISPECIES: chorismate mutase [Prochlorococcus]|uniref:chorismate mutase n=1 Tax=Prochlorococcus marinus (strain SARG / CCMP1375 / SS120) TaxID=167539 RepID=Q7VB04_PROMA|nr:chorismate mutase [Prochlorococcus marinus]AAQ00341.1 Chorismate mutase [Prochlorococcus marinus subsp. marinus str. CCMP1375]KGG14220.1 Chorismate mutase II [Prochlorococcus marinus str. LG]KGG22208.1 Chorismate mutase II [Prochlorococcus marinus str. SS2]KGG24475.1 Chorismate mutase II [Prochlorococcus marinus str. SS35]KGG33370.1 Chorismate mutase II [Prochlorococcus marinus str. SS51]
MNIRAIRGATTCLSNTSDAIESAVQELVSELVNQNKLKAKQIISVTFSVTNDLNACFPAAMARKQHGWEEVALLDCQQMYVKGDLANCIRILAIVNLPEDQMPRHTYLGEASMLRPDRSV